MKLWDKIAQDTRMIILLITTNIIQLFVIIGLIVSIMAIPTRFTFHIPPDVSNGVTLKPNNIPNAYVGQFAFYIWQVINNWQENGAKDSYQNLKLYGTYLTPEFRYYLLSRYKKLNQEGELQSRIRDIRPINGDKPIVKKIGVNSWSVALRVRDNEYVNGILVKDKEIEYPFKVVRFNGNAQINPFGLAIAGFMGNPKLISRNK